MKISLSVGEANAKLKGVLNTRNLGRLNTRNNDTNVGSSVEMHTLGVGLVQLSYDLSCGQTYPSDLIHSKTGPAFP